MKATLSRPASTNLFHHIVNDFYLNSAALGQVFTHTSSHSSPNLIRLIRYCDILTVLLTDSRRVASVPLSLYQKLPSGGTKHSREKPLLIPQELEIGFISV